MKELKKKRTRHFLIIALVCWGVCIGVGCFLFPALAKRFSEPIPLEEVDFSGEIDGLYVSGTIYGIYDWYCETTNKYSTTVGREYLIDADDYYYIALNAPSKKTVKVADTLMDATYAYMSGWDDGTKLLETQFEVTGTINKLSGDSLKYYKEFIGWDELDAETQEMFLLYTLEMDHYGHLQTKHIVILAIVFVIVFLLGLFSISVIRSKNEVEKYIENSANPEQMKEVVEEFLQTAPKYDKLRYNSDFICDNMGDLFLETKQLVWAYQHIDSHHNCTLVIGLVEGDTRTAILSTEKEINAHLARLQVLCPHAIIGYSDELKELYDGNRKEFLALRYNEHMSDRM